MKKLVLVSIETLVLVALATCAAAQAKAVFFSTNTLPPPNGMYISPAQWHALYANGIIISNVSHRRFTETQPPPGTGGSTTHYLNSELDFDISMNNGTNFTHATAPAIMMVNLQGISVTAAQQTYSNLMLQLNISGGTLPSAVQIRASPTVPSRGQTSVTPANGGYFISSFFDVFTEVSLDSGQTWSPSTQAGHMELRADPQVGLAVAEPGPFVPPPSDAYISPPGSQFGFPNGVLIRGIRSDFSSVMLNPQPFPPGGGQTLQFSAAVGLQVSIGGGTFVPLTGTAAMSVSIQNVHPGPPTFYDTEMLQLDLTLNGLPIGLRLRESPSLPSYGETALVQNSDGTYFISSFFDIFTELSTDGGQTWQPQTNPPTHVDLTPVALRTGTAVANLPPTNGQFNLPDLVRYPNNIVLSNVLVHLGPSQPPPPPGQAQPQTFTGSMEARLSVDGGQNFQTTTGQLTGFLVISNVTPAGTTGPARYFNTELQQLTVSGGSLPAGLMIRESPTKASLGRTTLFQDTQGYRVSGFFDIFTELSMDGGQSWNPALSDPAVVALVPNYPFAPYIINCPDNVTVHASSSSGAVVNYSLPPHIVPDCPFCCFGTTCVPPSGSVFPIGTTTVHCTGSDGCGEHPTCSFTVTVDQPFIYGGLFDSILGSATLSLVLNGTTPSMVVSNLGSGGNDGFHINVDAGDSLVLNFLPFPTTYNTCMVAQVLASYQLDDEHVMGIGTYFGGTNPMVRADFASVGASNVILEVTDENNHLVSTARYANAAWVDVNNLFPPCTNTTTVYTYGQTADHICYRFCRFGCNCIGTNCYIERIACFRPDLATLPVAHLTGFDLHSQGTNVPASLTILDQELGMFGLLHEAKGEATLEAHPGVLLVNGIGSSGQDGLAIKLNNAGQIDLTLAPTRLMSPNTCWKLTSFGRFNGEPNTELGAVSLSQSVGPGGGCDVKTDFSGIGGTQTRVDIYQGTQLAGSLTLPTGLVGTLFSSANLVACGQGPRPHPWFWLRFDSSFIFTAAGAQMSGDQIRLSAADVSSQTQSLSQFCLQGCNTGQFAILGASVSPTIGGILKRADGSFEIDGTGLAGVTYRLEGASKLSSPMQWTSFTSSTSDLNGSFHLIDSRTASAQQYYHVVTP